MENLSSLSLYAISEIIRKDWKKVYFGAVPYLDAMRHMRDVDTPFGDDDGRSIVRYFLSNATTWRGEVAKAVKAELKNRLK